MTLGTPVRVSLITMLVVLSCIGNVHAQSGAKIPDPDPEIERKALLLAEGFEINLLAADALLAKPLHMHWDPAGRLWVAFSKVYPQIKADQKPTDNVRILQEHEDRGLA